MAIPLPIIDSALGFIKGIADKIWPDPLQRAEAERKLLELHQAGEFKQIDAMLEQGRQQTDINKIEAASTNWFVAGWRPAIGWICGCAFGYNFVLQPFLQFAAVIGGLTFDTSLLPQLDTAAIFSVLTGMLGLGGLRTYEKFQEVEHVRSPATVAVAAVTKKLLPSKKP